MIDNPWSSKLKKMEDRDELVVTVCDQKGNKHKFWKDGKISELNEKARKIDTTKVKEENSEGKAKGYIKTPENKEVQLKNRGQKMKRSQKKKVEDEEPIAIEDEELLINFKKRKSKANDDAERIKTLERTIKIKKE